MFWVQSAVSSIRPEVTELPFTCLIQRMRILKKLKMNGFVQDCRHYSRLELDWKNLTELILQPAIGYRESALSPQEILNILALSDWVLADGNPVVNLPEMREMQIILSRGVSLPAFVPMFFRSLLCPSLKRFSVRSSRKGLIDMISALPSPQNLETLSLNIPMSANELLKCLSLVPSLRFLEIGKEAIIVNDGGLQTELTKEDLQRMQVLVDSGMKMRIRYGKMPPMPSSSLPFEGVVKSVIRLDIGVCFF
ncbi:hypothetical protein BT96DRAFT_940701 [Gymnopus androsaceus JB14]|uniref:F-box domain-containing protein n=1 Tax=Gymnopus androsaceus JB14 TaxID=1447944 RepID=A0A6A4HLT0_9AGAR|nr:hypothetical protein BT96DRAFT_940701 [Gymnopus androsaceus JB14]